MALQLAVRVERTDPPNADGAAVACALATIALLDDDRSGPEGPWHDAVERWNGAKIRKIVRRGRASGWRRAEEAEGVTVEVDGVQARAFVPGPIDRVPAPVAKLQIQASPLEESEPVAELPAEVLDPDRPGLLVVVTPEVEMSWGKRAAQCAHATHRAWMRADPARRQAWTEAGRPLTVLRVTPALWLRLVDDADVTIRDGGFTEIPAGTMTTAARWIVPG
ncbi:MAG: peptidyl-tRNA hydrolase [Actinomycetota bacterium]